MASWIRVTRPFEYRWPDSNAITVFSERDLGDHFVKDELAAHAIEKGHAKEGKESADSRSQKGGKIAQRRRPAKGAVDGAATDLQSADRLDGAGLASDDSADDRGAVDQASG